MRFKYRNVKTGNVIESNSEISAPNWIKEGAEAPAKPRAVAPAEPDPVPDEDEEVTDDFFGVDDIIKPDEPAEPKSKRSSKKPAKRSKR